MPGDGAGSAALSGAASGAAAGAVFGPWGAVIGGVVGGVAGYFSAPKTKKLDIGKVISDARQQSENNLKDSIDLENKYMPGTASLRAQADQSLLNTARGNTSAARARNNLVEQLQQKQSNPLLDHSATSILNSLKQGGRLDPETQAAVMRGSLEAGGSAGISGSGAGRGLQARDLGLTSLQLLTQRQQAAQGAGIAQANFNLNDLLGRTGALNSIVGQDASNAFNVANLVDARARPVSGLSGSALASLETAGNNTDNQNAVNQAAVRQQQLNSGLTSLAALGGAAKGWTSGASATTGSSYDDMAAAMNKPYKG